MAVTPNLGLTLMSSNDAQKEVLFNEAVILFDVMAARIVTNFRTAPPGGTPAVGAAYIVANTGTTGAFVGHENQIVFYFNGWQYITPVTKMRLYVTVQNNFYTFNGTTWAADSTSAVNTLDDLTDVIITSVANNDIIQYESATNKWKNKQITVTTSIAGMTDVSLDSPADGDFLIYDSTLSKWANLSISLVNELGDLADVDMSGIADNKLLAWDSGVAKWVNPSVLVPTGLADMTDVDVSSAVENDALVFNGAVWGPSTLTFNYTFENMTDGPGTLEGHAGKFLTVDETESALEFRSILELLPDFPEYSVYDDGETVTGDMVSLNFVGFGVTETGGAVTITALGGAFDWMAEGEVVDGDPVIAINFTGSGVEVTNTDGVLDVDITAGLGTVDELADLTDVDLTTPPADGDTLVWDDTANKWKPGAGGGGGGGGGGSNVNVVVLPSNVTINAGSNTHANLTGLSFTGAAGKTYWIKAIGIFSPNADSCGAALGVAGAHIASGWTYNIGANVRSGISTGMQSDAGTIGFGGPGAPALASNNAQNAGSYNNITVMEGVITMDGTGGTVQITAANELSSNPSVWKAVQTNLQYIQLD